MWLLTALVVVLATNFRPTTSLGFHTLVPDRFQDCCGDEQLDNCGIVDSIARGPDGNHYVFVSGAVYQVRMSQKGFPEVYEGAMWDDSVWFSDNRQETGQTSVNRTTAAVLLSIEGQKPLLVVSKGGLFYKFHKLPTEEGYKLRRDVNSTADCHDVHPLFCDDSLGDLVDATASSIRGTTSEDEVKAYYRGLDAKGNADYHERNYVGYRPVGSSVDVPFESVSSVTVYDAEIRVFDNIQRDRGYVFEDTGFACRWELYRNEEQLQLIDALRQPLVNCLPTNVFLGCPQSWCLNSAVDDMLVTTLPHDDGSVSKRLVVYRGHYHFDTEPTVPASVPKATRMQLSHESQKASARRHAYIDAAFEVEFSGDRTFTGFVKDTDVVIYDSTTGDKVEKKIYDVFPRLWSSLVGNDNLGTIDAAYHTPSRELVLLIGAKYVVYTYETRQVPTGVSLVFNFVRDGWFFNGLKGLPLNVDGAVDMEGKVYVFKDNWVYTKSEISSLAGLAKWTPEFAYYDTRARTGFWNVAGVCSWKDDVWTSIRRSARPAPSLMPPSSDQAPAGYPFNPVLGFILLVLFNFLPFVMTFFSDPELDDEHLEDHVNRHVNREKLRVKGILTLQAAKARHSYEEMPSVHVCKAGSGEPCNCPAKNVCACIHPPIINTNFAHFIPPSARPRNVLPPPEEWPHSSPEPSEGTTTASFIYIPSPTGNIPPPPSPPPPPPPTTRSPFLLPPPKPPRGNMNDHSPYGKSRQLYDEVYKMK